MSGEKDNLSLVLLEKGNLQLKQIPIPSKPGSNEVILKTLSVGICGSDVHYWTHGSIGNFIVTAPIVLGHESSAEVVEVGSNVTHLKPGDKVAIEPGIACGLCDECRTGKYNLCPKMTFHATPPDDGTLTRYFRHHADYCFKLPSNMSADEGALLEPLSVGVYSCQRAGVKAGGSLLICGSGPIGLVTLLAAKAFGASHICITDVNETRLKLAKEIGATSTLLLNKDETPAATAEKVIQLIGKRPDYAIDCVGFEGTITTGLLATRAGGAFVLTGMGQDKVTIPLLAAACREVDIFGIFRYKNTWPLCLQLVQEGKIDLSKLVTHRFPLEKAIDAFEVAKSGQGIKVIIDCSGQNSS